MGEYVLKCEPMETHNELKEVLKFLDNPLFTSSIINPEFIYYFLLIIGILMTLISGYKLIEKYLIKENNINIWYLVTFLFIGLITCGVLYFIIF